MAETAKNGFKYLKMHSNTYSPKRGKNAPKNGKNGRKLQIIVKFQKLQNMVKKLQLTKMSNKCNKNAKNGPKTGKNGKISNFVVIV